MTARSDETWDVQNIKVLLVGVRFSGEQRMLNTWTKELKLNRMVKVIPFMERKQLFKVMKDCNLSVYPAFRDSGSMSVLEASALACPTICFNAGGQDAFPDDVLFKVEIGNSYEETLESLADKLLWIYRHPKEAKAVGSKAKEYVEKNLTWKQRVSDFHDIYRKLLS